MPKTKDGGGGKTRPPKSKYPPKPEIPFRIGDGDANYLRKLYADDYTDKQGRRGYKELLDEAYSEYKEKLDAGFAKEIGLPDTLRELLGKETGNIEGDATPGTFPARVYIGIIGKANLIWEDTLRAKAVINVFDGNKPGQMPRFIKDEISSIFDDYGMEPTIRDELALPFVVATFENEQDPATTFEESISKLEERAKAFFYPSDFIYQFALSTNGADKDKAYKATLKTGKGVVADVLVSIAEKLEAETGEDAAQILDKKKRTQEQYRLLVKAVRKVITARTETLYKSKFMQAVWTMQTTDTSEKAQKLSSATHSAAIKYACYYFFAKNPEIDFREQDTLKDEYAQEVKDIYTRLTDSMADQLRAASQKKKTLSAWDAFMNFIKEENPDKKTQEEVIAHVKAIPTDKLLDPIDKPNYKLWDMARDSAENGGQLTLDIFMGTEEEQKKGKEPLVYLALTFADELPAGVEITKSLDSYDKRVYLACGALYNAGNQTVSISQIHKQMGYTTRPAKVDMKKINDSLTKMGFGRLYIDNEKETKYHKSYTGYKDDYPLLAFKRRNAYINGQLVEGAIHLLDEPIMIKFARERKQVQQITLQMLQTPISKTARNLEIEDYLLYRIGRMKSPRGTTQRKILYESVFTYCRINGRVAKSRTKENIEKILEHYKKSGFIKGYEKAADGVIIDP